MRNDHIGVRVLLAAAVGLLLVALRAPIWTTRLEAPQYHGEEALHVRVYAGHISGDLHELETLNQYIGVTIPTDIVELRVGPWLLGAFLMLALFALLSSEVRQHRAAALLLVLMVLSVVGAAASAEYRLYALGHDRGHTPFARVEDFTPPLLGTTKIENFEVSTALAPGGLAYLGALLLAGTAAWLTREKRTSLRAPEFDQQMKREGVLDG